ncbi:MAG: hypothetical protein JXA25_01625 [Anaerolineales bacterium]|nr:hypothetical protein [Anaerolineales bacterium]
MNKSVFRKLEKQIHLRYHSDGILDLTVGGVLLGFGLDMTTESPAYIVLSWLPLLLYFPLKNMLSLPRIGYAQFHSEKKRTTLLSLALAIGIFVLAAILILIRILSAKNQSPNSLLQSNPMMFLSLLFAGMLCTAAAWTKSIRFLGYASLTILITGGVPSFGFSEPTAVMLNGALILIAGSFLLFRFLQNYPIPNDTDKETHDRD